MDKIRPSELKVGDLVSPQPGDYRLVTLKWIDQIGQDVRTADINTGRESLLCLCKADKISYIPAAELPF